MNAGDHLLLTGATGFFGKALLRHWAAGAPPVGRVTALSRDPQAFARDFPELAALPWLDWHAGDITDPDSLPQQSRFSHVMHAAADSTRGPQLTPLQRFEQIVQGTHHLLDLAVRCKARRFLLTSSGAVYGAQPTHLKQIPEDWLGIPDPLDANQVYGVSKRAAEHLCALYHRQFGLPTVIARCFAFVGPDLPLDVHFAIGNFIRDALWSEAIVVQGDGSPVRSYLDQRDLAHWLLALLERGRAGQAYNVGSEEGLTVSELAHLVRDVLAPNKTVQLRHLEQPQNGRNQYVPDTRKLRMELCLGVTVSLAQSIADTAAIARARRADHEV